MNKVLIKDIPNNDRPRERFLSLGAKNVSNEDLISIILKTGTKNRSVKDLSITLLSKFKDISNFKDLEVNSITNIDGIWIIDGTNHPCLSWELPEITE